MVSITVRRVECSGHTSHGCWRHTHGVLVPDTGRTSSQSIDACPMRVEASARLHISSGESGLAIARLQHRFIAVD